MAEPPRQIEGATGGAEPTQGATGGQELNPYATGVGQVQPRSPDSMFLQQQGTENVAMHASHFHFYMGPMTIIHGDVRGDHVSSTTNFQDTQVGSLGVSSGPSGPPILQVSGTPGALTDGPSAAEQQRTLVQAFSNLVSGLHLSEEVKQQTLEALQGAVAPATPQQAIDQSGEPATKAHADSSTEVHIPTDAVIEKMSEIKLDDDIEKLVKQGFEALIRDDDSEKTSLDFIKAYEEEEASILSEFYEDRQELNELMDKAWEDIHLELVSTTCGRHLDDNIGIKRALAHICANLSAKLRKQNKYESYLMKSTPRAEDIYDMGEDFASNENYIHAIISFYTAAKLFKKRKMGNDSVRGIHDCSGESMLVVEEMAKQEPLRRIILHHVVPIMIETMNSIRSIQEATHSFRIEYEAWCLYYIGACYGFCGKDQQLANESACAIKLLETEFTEKARMYRVYGVSLYGAAVAYIHMQNIAKAVELCKEVLEAYEHAEDWSSEEQKNKLIKNAKNNLREAKAALENKKWE